MTKPTRKKTTKRPEPPPKGSVSIEVPFAIPTTGYGSHGSERHRVDTKLTMVQTRGVTAIFTALNRAHATLKNGRHVERPVDAVRWMLERVEEMLPATNGETG